MVFVSKDRHCYGPLTPAVISELYFLDFLTGNLKGDLSGKILFICRQSQRAQTHLADV